MYIAPHVGRSAGIDTSERSVEQAKRTFPSGEFLPYDGRDFPYEGGTFDVSFAINVLHHVDPIDRDRFVGEMLRVTRPNGLVVVFEHNPVNPLTRLTVARCEFDEGVVLAGSRSVARLLRGNGASMISSRYVLFLPIDRPWARTVEGWLGWLPMGAQHMTVAARSS